MTRRRHRAGRGFSLFELVAVLIIIAIVSAIAAPRYASSLDRFRIDRAANRVVVDLAYARGAAEAASASTTVVFDVAASAYTMSGLTDPRTGAGSYRTDLAAEPYRATIVTVAMDDPTALDDTASDVTFDGFGRPDSAGTVVLSIAGRTRTITLDPDTGVASVQ
jgi:prepilin-type N-terminal cleavage/methylation domain-containing protein